MLCCTRHATDYPVGKQHNPRHVPDAVSGSTARTGRIRCPYAPTPQTNTPGPGIYQLVKSPVNYPGGKFRLLPQILPHLPETIETFIDLFAGATDTPYNPRRAPAAR